jgi:prevent-host-death family protein
MSVIVSVEEASSHLPALLARLNADTTEIIIAKNGTPVARLLPAAGLGEVAQQPRAPGEDRGLFTVPPQFVEPLPDDMLDAMYGRAEPR